MDQIQKWKIREWIENGLWIKIQKSTTKFQIHKNGLWIFANEFVILRPSMNSNPILK